MNIYSSSGVRDSFQLKKDLIQILLMELTMLLLLYNTRSGWISMSHFIKVCTGHPWLQVLPDPSTLQSMNISKPFCCHICSIFAESANQYFLKNDPKVASLWLSLQHSQPDGAVSSGCSLHLPLMGLILSLAWFSARDWKQIFPALSREIIPFGGCYLLSRTHEIMDQRAGLWNFQQSWEIYTKWNSFISAMSSPFPKE